MVSDRMGARAVDVLLGQINDSEGPPQQVVMRTLFKVLLIVRLPSHRLLGCFVTRRRLMNLVLSAQPMQNEQHAHHHQDSPARARVWGHDHDDTDEPGPDKGQDIDETAQVPKVPGAAIFNPARFLSPPQIHGDAIG